MAQTMSIRLNRSDNTSWGFRLQGGKDFSTPVSIQRVNPGSIAERAGLQAGDGILKIAGSPTEMMRHKDAQDTIKGAGSNFELLVQRGAVNVWKPAVTPIDDLKSGPRAKLSSGGPGPMTKTSLAADKQNIQPIGSSHNIQAKPFALDGNKQLVHNQYNSPAGLYSMNNIAETLSAQAEVLNTGAVGINFMKENQPINKDSAVYRMIQEETDVPQGTVTKPVAAPVPKPPSETSVQTNQNLCFECGRLIVGVFVKINEKPLHAECFKCSTCGTSLKNVGYHNINDKLYCSLHATQVARMNVPDSTSPSVGGGQSNLAPFVLKKSSAPAAPHSPGVGSASPGVGVHSPIPFHGTPKPHHVDAPVSPTPTSSPFFAPSAQQSSSTTESYSSIKRQTKTTQQTNRPMSVPSNLSHPNTAPVIGAHKQSVGGAKFTWPPSAQPVSEETTVTETNTSTSFTSYRAPPETQKIQYQSKAVSDKPRTPSATTPPATASKPIFAPKTNSNPYAAAPVTPPAPKPSTPSAMTSKPSLSSTRTGSSPGSYGGRQSQGGAGPTGPNRGRGTLTTQVAPGTRIPICATCGSPIRGPFVTAMGKTWCPEHFSCSNVACHRPLQDIGFVEEKGQMYCENCYEQHLAPICSKCKSRIKGNCLNALDRTWHPECFICAHCKQPFGSSSFYMEDGNPYCETDWNDLFTTKCVGCGFAIEAGDRWVEALNNNYHSQCFRCSVCQTNLEGQSFYAKGGKPFCKNHAR